MAYVLQVCILIHANYDRPHAFPAAARFGKSADDRLLPHQGPDLQPLAAAPTFSVRARSVLRHDTFNAALGGYPEQRQTVRFDVIAVLHAVQVR